MPKVKAPVAAAASPSWDPQSDPLGLGLQQRAATRRFQMAAAGMTSPIGPLPDPQWDAYFEAVAEANPGKSVRFGPSGTEEPDLTRDPNYLDQINRAMPMQLPPGAWTAMQSNQLGTPVPRGRK